MAKMATMEMAKWSSHILSKMNRSAFRSNANGDVVIAHHRDHGGCSELVRDLDAVDVTDGPDCVCCLKGLKDNDVVVVSDCGHFMCLECSNEWEDSTCETDMQFNCPLCREVIETRTICIARTFARGTGVAEDPIIIR